MERQGYFVKWTDTRKTITYTCPNGKSCRDDRLFGNKFSKANMELEFDYRQQKKEIKTESGWEYERKQFENTTPQAGTTGDLQAEKHKQKANQ
jgi:hypothetical protein